MGRFASVHKSYLKAVLSHLYFIFLNFYPCKKKHFRKCKLNIGTDKDLKSELHNLFIFNLNVTQVIHLLYLLCCEISFYTTLVFPLQGTVL